jgi:hypothetical protein
MRGVSAVLATSHVDETRIEIDRVPSAAKRVHSPEERVTVCHQNQRLIAQGVPTDPTRRFDEALHLLLVQVLTGAELCVLASPRRQLSYFPG